MTPSKPEAAGKRPGRRKNTAKAPAKKPGTAGRKRVSPAPARASARAKAFPIVGIGASAGGLESYARLLNTLPIDTGMAFVLVQHLDPTHESILPQLLSKSTRMQVSEAKDGMAVEANHVYVMPPNVNMALFHRTLNLMPRAEVAGRHLPVDYFLRSLAEDLGEKAIGVILSGTASDGALGLRSVKAEGGITFAQDPASAKYDGMPSAAIAAGVVDFILPLEGIAAELSHIGRHPYVAHKRKGKNAESLAGGDDLLNKIFIMLRTATGVDFALYKHTTIQRRIARRMALQRIEELGSYVDYMRRTPEEVKALYQDILITVTDFFREPKAFEVLKREVFPEIMKRRSVGEPIRVWVPGCSTGEEPYSIAMCLLEFLKDEPKVPQVQIFATDINELAIERARAGVYPESAVESVSQERLSRFFRPVETGHEISKLIREMCVFAKHDVTKDPPFSRMDLISFRNALIYLGPVLQNKVIPVLHYALQPWGYLFLGTSETVGQFSDLFSLTNSKYKVYSKKPGAARPAGTLAFSGPGAIGGEGGPGLITADVQASSPFDVQREADGMVLAEYGPPGVIVTDSMEVVQFRGSTGTYLEPAPGKASFNLVSMARRGLAFGLRTAIREASKSGEPAMREHVRFTSTSGQSAVDIEVTPIRTPSAERYYLVLFHDVSARATTAASKATPPSSEEEEAAEIADLRRELAAAGEYLRSTVEDKEAANEELKAANEEIQSSNEELQSINEELETAKEELQSSNEELTTVNEEMQNRNVELSRLNDDLGNVLESTSIPTVMLGSDLRIRRFTPGTESVLNLIPTDLGRPLGDIKPKIDMPDLAQVVAETIDTVTVRTREAQREDGRWYSVRVQPYKTADRRIDGAVLTFVDIDDLKQGERQIEESRDFAQAIVETVREPLVVLDADSRVVSANEAFYGVFDVDRSGTQSKTLYELGSRQWDIPALRKALGELLPKKSRLDDFEVTHEFPKIGRRTMLLNARQIERDAGETPMILLAIEDITERERGQEELRASRQQMESTLESIGDAFFTLDREWRFTYVNQKAEGLMQDEHDALLGKRIWDVFPEATRSSFYTEYHHAMDGVPVAFEEFYAPFDQWFDVRAYPYPDGISVYFREVTERHRAAELSQALDRINLAMSSTLSAEQVMSRALAEAALAMGCESSAITLHENDEWVVRHVDGFPEETVGTRFTDDDAAHFAVAARARKPLVVDDVDTDESADYTETKKAGIRSFVAAPLVVRESVIGMLTFHYRSKAVRFSPSQVDFATKLAASLALALENARLYQEEHRIAETLQQSLIRPVPAVPGLEIGLGYRTAYEPEKVAGDFYDIFQVGDSEVAVLIGDVAGKGIEAAGLTETIRSAVRSLAYLNADPSFVLTQANAALIDQIPKGEFATAALLVADMESGQMSYASAGHPPLLLCRGKCRPLKTAGQFPLGLYPVEAYEKTSLKWRPGQTVVLYTDGLTEARSASELFGEERLVQVLEAHEGLGAQELVDSVLDAVTEFSDAGLSDDMAIVAIRFLPRRTRSRPTAGRPRRPA